MRRLPPIGDEKELPNPLHSLVGCRGAEDVDFFEALIFLWLAQESNIFRMARAHEPGSPTEAG